MSVRQLENVEEYVVLERSFIRLLDKYLILIKKCLKVRNYRQYLISFIYIIKTTMMHKEFILKEGGLLQNMVEFAWIWF